MGIRSLSATTVKISINTTVRNAMTITSAPVAQSPVMSTNEDSLDSGVSVGEANRAWKWESVLNSGSNLVFDLFDLTTLDAGAGAGDDFLGQPISPFEEIVCILIKNANPASTLLGTLEIIPDATNGWTPIGSHTTATGGALRSQGILVKYNPAEEGFDINDGVSNRIRLDAVGANIAIEVVLLARHDDNESSSSSSSSSSNSSSSSVSSVSSVSSSSSSASSVSSVSSSSSSLSSESSSSSQS